MALMAGLFARLAAAAARCGRLGEDTGAARTVLAPLHVLLQWFATRPDLVMGWVLSGAYATLHINQLATAGDAWQALQGCVLPRLHCSPATVGVLGH